MTPMPNTQVVEPPPARRLLDVKQVAGMLDCSWRTVLRHAGAGTFPSGHKIGALRRLDASYVDSLINNGCKMPKPAGRRP